MADRATRSPARSCRHGWRRPADRTLIATTVQWPARPRGDIGMTVSVLHDRALRIGLGAGGGPLPRPAHRSSAASSGPANAGPEVTQMDNYHLRGAARVGVPVRVRRGAGHADSPVPGAQSRVRSQRTDGRRTARLASSSMWLTSPPTATVARAKGWPWLMARARGRGVTVTVTGVPGQPVTVIPEAANVRQIDALRALAMGEEQRGAGIPGDRSPADARCGTPVGIAAPPLPGTCLAGCQAQRDRL